MGKRMGACCRDEEAATAIEYALLASLVSIAGFTALVSLGNALGTMYGMVANAVSDSISGGG